MAGQLDTVAQLAQLLGGTKTTGTADTAALQQVLAQMQQQNTPEGQAAQLQALFQQAAGAIPGLQGAYANAVGARRGGNSAVQGALNKLLSQVTLAGQQQQNTNLNNQAQAAGALANATRGTQASTNLGGVVRNLLLAQGLAEGNKAIKGAGGLGSIMSNALGNMLPTSEASAGLDNTEVMQSSPMDFNNVPGISLDLSGGGNILSDGFDMGNIDMGFDPGMSGDAEGIDFGGGGLLDELASYGVFADGGLVGRDGGVPAFADGGQVTLNASGARRSAAQSINPVLPEPMSATNQAPQTVSAPTGGISLGDIAGSGGMGPGPVNYQQNELADGIRAVAANPIARLVANLALPGIGSVMSMAALPANATNEQALGAFARPVASMAASEVLGGITPAQSLIANTLVSSLSADRSTGGQFGRTGAFGTNNSAANTGTGSGFGAGMNGGINAADGGAIEGPGTGVSDSIPARLSDGEYVISKDVVDAIGVDFFDKLQELLHTPAAQQRAK
jgi:hypothetical protein